MCNTLAPFADAVQPHIARALADAELGPATTAALVGAAAGLATRGMSIVATALRDWFARHDSIDFNCVTLHTPTDDVVLELLPFIDPRLRALLLHACPVTALSLPPLLSHIGASLKELTIISCNWLESASLMAALPALSMLQLLRVERTAMWQGDLSPWVEHLPRSLLRLEIRHCGRLLVGDAVAPLPPLLEELVILHCARAADTRSHGARASPAALAIA